MLCLCSFANVLVIHVYLEHRDVHSRSIIDRTRYRSKTSCLWSVVFLHWCIRSPNWRFMLVWCIYYRHLCIAGLMSCYLRTFERKAACCLEYFFQPFVKYTPIDFILHDIWVRSCLLCHDLVVICHEYFFQAIHKIYPDWLHIAYLGYSFPRTAWFKTTQQTAYFKTTQYKLLGSKQYNQHFASIESLQQYDGRLVLRFV